MDSDIGRSTDRIGKLPDSVLCHILSFLPTKYAVGTSILSRRWQYLWTCVSSLDFDDSLLFHSLYKMSVNSEFEVDLNFTNFVNRVLLLSDASRWKNFSLKLGSVDNFDLVNTWICVAIKRNVQKMDLYYYLELEHEYYNKNPVPLPHAVFTCKTLVHLRLEGDIILKIPASVWLPCLKNLLLLDIKFENEDSSQKLFSACPVLEELFMLISRWLSDTQQVLNISVPTLKSLMVNRLKEYLDDDSNIIDESNDQRYKLVVNAPKLERLHVTDYVAEDFSLENLSSLLKAYLVIGPSCSRPVNSPTMMAAYLIFLVGLQMLSFLIEVKDYVLPTFHNLTHLRIGADGTCSWNLDLLKMFLEYSPKLEVLILEGNRVLGSAEVWSPPPQVPSCLLLHLKEIEILKFDGKEYMLDVIEYLLKNAIVL